MVRILELFKRKDKARGTRIKSTGKSRALFIVIFIILCAHAATFLGALFTVFINTFKNSLEYALGNTYGLPDKWLWSNYKAVFKTLNVNGTGYFGLVFNTLWQTVGVAVPTIASTTMASYAYARYKFPGRRAVYMIAIILLTISLPGALPATYKLYSDLRMRNSPLFLLGATAGLGTYFIVLTGFWRSVSWEYAESALIDGAGDFTVFLKIMVPQAMPMIGTMFLLMFMGGWTDHATSMIYLPEYPTMAFGLYEYEIVTGNRGMNYPVYFAGLLLAAIPSLTLFALFQKRIMTSMNIGGLKG